MRTEPFRALDGSTVHERAHTAAVSLAEATVAPGAATVAHQHAFEEIYLFGAGTGRMRLGDDERPVAGGDCVVIPPGTPHKLWAGGSDPLVLLCVCAPPYADAGTTLLEDAA